MLMHSYILFIFIHRMHFLGRTSLLAKPQGINVVCLYVKIISYLLILIYSFSIKIKVNYPSNVSLWIKVGGAFNIPTFLIDQ